MRILHVTRRYTPEIIGGYEKNCQRFSEEWVRRGHDVAILTRKPSGAQRRDVRNGVKILRDLPDVPESRGIHGFRSRLYQLRVGWANRQGHRATQRILRSWKPDTVVFWGMNSWLVSPVRAVCESGLPCLADLGDYWLAESLEMYTPPSKRRAWYRRNVMLGGTFSADMFNEVWVHSRYMQRLYREVGVPPQRVQIIPRGLEESMLDAPPPQPKRSGPVRILCVGRLVPDKGARVLAKAFSLLHQSGVTAELHFYGDAWDWYQADLERDCREYGLLDTSIHIHGRVRTEEMPEVYRQHDILAFPVLWDEPSSNVLLEGMASRLPIVATRTGSNDEFVEHGRSGFLVAPDSPAELADRLRDLVQDPRLRQEMGNSAYEKVQKRHHMQTVFDRTEERLRIVANMPTSGNAEHAC